MKLTTEEPDAGKPLVRVCGGAGRQRTALPGRIMAQTTNYDVRDKWNTEAFSTWQDAVKASIAEVLLPAKFPDAVAQVSGIDVIYQVAFIVYSGVSEQHTWKFQCTKSGPNPEFVFVE